MDINMVKKKKKLQTESQNRIDSIIALMIEEAKSVDDPNPRARFFHVYMKVRERVFKIMRTLEK